MINEFKNKIDSKIEELKSEIRNNDPIIKFLLKDHIKIDEIDFGLRILPMELIEKYGGVILQDKKEYLKYHDPKYNCFLNQWNVHLEGYWKDKLQLLNEYLKPIAGDKTPMDVYNGLNDLMIKIERRACLLNPDPNIVEQKHQRVSGEVKEYTFIRSYWVDDKGYKKRMVSRHVGNKYDKVEEEIGTLFHIQGFAVHRQYKVSQNGTQKVYDLVIERDGMKLAVELKNVKGSKELFHELFMFDELLRRFKDDYPKG